MGQNPNVMNAQEAGEYLGAHVETIRRLARKGDIPAYKIGKDWRFRRDALDRWAEENNGGSRSKYLLVVEDDESVRGFLKKILEKEGYRVHLAAGAAEGLSCLQREPVDLILLDLKMPGMNGVDFLRRLDEMDQEYSVIIVTGYPDSYLMQEALKFGPITLIAKPIDQKQLMRAVRTALNGRLKDGVRHRL